MISLKKSVIKKVDITQVFFTPSVRNITTELTRWLGGFGESVALKNQIGGKMAEQKDGGGSTCLSNKNVASKSSSRS